VRTVHYQVPCNAGDLPCPHAARACNRTCWQAATGLPATTVVADVTCRRCRTTAAYLSALGREPSDG